VDDIVDRLKATLKKAVGTSARWLMHDLHDGIHEIVRLRAALEEEVDLADALAQKAWALLETDARYDCLTLGGPCDFCDATEDLNEVLQEHAQRRKEIPQ
jgi:hypothetical protein